MFPLTFALFAVGSASAASLAKPSPSSDTPFSMAVASTRRKLQSSDVSSLEAQCSAAGGVSAVAQELTTQLSTIGVSNVDATSTAQCICGGTITDQIVADLSSSNPSTVSSALGALCTDTCKGFLDLIYQAIGQALAQQDPSSNLDSVFSSLTSCLCDAGSSFAQFISGTSGTEPTDAQIAEICSYSSCQTMITSLGAATGTAGPSCPTPGGGDNPCFSRDATACRARGARPSTSAAFDACFGAGGEVAERVAMAQLVSGDMVLSTDASGEPVWTRVVVNQHRAYNTSSTLVTLHHTNGSLSLTADHVLRSDGTFQAARHVAEGAVLSTGAAVTRVEAGTGGVVNPVTVNGKILAAAATGAPVEASTHPEWLASFFLTSSVPFPYSLTSLLSYLFPAEAQSFYDDHLEPISDLLVSVGRHAATLTLPRPLVVSLVLLADVTLAAWAVVVSCGQNSALTLAVALAGVGAVGASMVRSTRGKK